MQCLACGRKLPLNRRAGMNYCSPACRASAFRRRDRERGRSAANGDDSAPQADTDTTGEAAQPRRATRRARRRVLRESHAQTSAQPAQDKRLKRIPFDVQVQSQAPPGAVGYRLVLPSRSHGEMPRLIPGTEPGGRQSAFSLIPFELPDDIRLRDGHVYRILWVGPQGLIIPPTGTRQLPALHFFLGDADAEVKEKEDKYSSILRDISDPTLRRDCEAAIANLRLEELRDLHTVAMRERELALTAANQRLEDDALEAARQRHKVKEEDWERAAVKHAERLEKEMAAQKQAAHRNMLTQLGIVFGMPSLGIALEALLRKLDGDPMGWPEVKAQILKIMEALPSVVKSLQQPAESSSPQQDRSPQPDPNRLPG